MIFSLSNLAFELSKSKSSSNLSGSFGGLLICLPRDPPRGPPLLNPLSLYPPSLSLYPPSQIGKKTRYCLVKQDGNV